MNLRYVPRLSEWVRLPYYLASIGPIVYSATTKAKQLLHGVSFQVEGPIVAHFDSVGQRLCVHRRQTSGHPIHFLTCTIQSLVAEVSQSNWYWTGRRWYTEPHDNRS